MKTAKNAGYYVIGVYDESAAKNWEAVTKIADEVIDNWEEQL